MTNKKLSLHADKRELLGKKVKRLRKEGLIPAVVYGSGLESVTLKLPSLSFVKFYKEVGDATLFDLEIEGEKETHKVLVKDIDIDYLRRQVTHVSFYKVDMKKTMDTEVPVELVGVAPAIKEGGILVHSIQDLGVRCLPADLPSEIEVDITGLEGVGDTIALSAVKLPKGVTLLREEDEMNLSVVSIIAPITQEQEEAAAEDATDVDDVEVTEGGAEAEEGAEDAEGEEGEEKKKKEGGEK